MPGKAQEVGVAGPSQPFEPAAVAGRQQHECVRPPALGAEPNRMNLDRALAENCRAATRSVASAGSGTSRAGPATPGTTNL
jgi:hypothetical protein